MWNLDRFSKQCRPRSDATVSSGPFFQLSQPNSATNVSVLSKFDFQGPGLKVTVTVAIFRKNFVITLAPIFIDGFYYNFTQM